MQALSSIGYKIETAGYKYFYEKAPPTPESIRRMIAKYLIIGLLLFILWQGYTLVKYISFELTAPSVSYLYSYGSGGYGIIGIMLVGMSIVMELAALLGLFHYKRIGWLYLFYGQILAILNELVHLNLINFIFGTIISFYLLFQIRGYYR